MPRIQKAITVVQIISFQSTLSLAHKGLKTHLEHVFTNTETEKENEPTWLPSF